ncbi:hypothetical protein IFM89_028454 [Coptis chinensis]|uniref:Uncharacterized protein n=1 Tax=Coptis chinensis TaxID=261450 RepID=A0A835MFH6_9MAGN|nr:hypothetical protein IFM89_028454 [Coptis chinensis]
MVVITEEMRAKTDLCFGDEEGKERSKFLLKEVGLPTSLLPLRDILEYGYMEDNRLYRNWWCVKIKEMLIWVSLNEMSIDNPVDGRIAFKGLAGLYRTYPFSAFDNPEVKIQLEYKLPPKIIDNVEVAEEVKEAMVAKEVGSHSSQGSEGTHGSDQESRGTHSGQGSDKLVSVYQ